VDNHTVQVDRYANLQRGKLSFCTRVVGRDMPRNLNNRDGPIEFTESSRKRFARYLKNAEAEYRVFITLTYPPGFGEDGHRVKRDLATFAKRYRRAQEKAGRENYSLVWWQEWQANGRCHLHLLGSGYWEHDRLAEAWCSIVGSQNRDHLRAGTEIRKIKGKRAQIARYAVKYAVKTEQKQVPEGYGWCGRFWGVYGNRKTVEASTRIPAFQFEVPEVQECIRNMKKVQEELTKAKKMVYLLIDKDNYRVAMYVWPPDQELIRYQLLKKMVELNNEIAIHTCPNHRRSSRLLS
jgi:hypothetical protein